MTTVIHGDCLDVMPTLDAESIDAIVTDPPYWYGFMGKEWDGGSVEGEDAAFGYYLAGLTDGEGHFRVQRQARGTYQCAFTIHLRRDDRAILERARRFLGVGSITEDGDGTDRSPMVRLAVQAKADCLRVVEVFTRYPLRAKKLQDFIPWAEAVVEWNEMKVGHRWSGRADWRRMAALKVAVERAREYRDPPWSGHSYQDWSRQWAEELLRVAKPGAHLLAFGGTRTYHRLACAIEDAGWEVRDCLVWAYASGFPKSLDVSKAIDKAAGATRARVAGPKSGGMASLNAGNAEKGYRPDGYYEDGNQMQSSVPVTPEAAKWDGWGTALKPAWEPIILARKPLRGTVAANVQAYGTGALNIDGTRVEGQPDKPGTTPPSDGRRGSMAGPLPRVEYQQPSGRWPANVILTDPIFDGGVPGVVGGGMASPGTAAGVKGSSGFASGYDGEYVTPYGDSGTYSRFFLIPKAARSDREPVLGGLLREAGAETPMAGRGQGGLKCQRCGHWKVSGNPCTCAEPEFVTTAFERPARANHHPTVKPLDLMRHLVRLVTPPGGIVLDPFLGSGTTALAAEMEGFGWVGIEREAEYVAIAEARLNGTQKGLGL